MLSFKFVPTYNIDLGFSIFKNMVVVLRFLTSGSDKVIRNWQKPGDDTANERGIR